MSDNIDSAQRANSPAVSDTSEITVLSRSPSPVPEYESFLAGIRNKLFSSTPSDAPERSPRSVPRHATVGDEPETSDQLRSPDGRFVPRRLRRARSPSPERLVNTPYQTVDAFAGKNR
jgi:hypothetical protein